MAIIVNLTSRLKRRFSGLSDEHIQAAISDGLGMLGYDAATVPEQDITLLLPFISAEIATELATNAASYFSFTDGEESVDKSKIMANYSALAEKFKSEYDAEVAARAAAMTEVKKVFHVMKRVDRD